MRIQHPKEGFTLIELLVVIAIIALLASMIFSIWPGVRRRMNSTVTMSNMRQIIIGMSSYAAEHNGKYPSYTNDSGTDKETWRFRILWKNDYLTDYRVFQNPTNQRAGTQLGKNIFGTGNGSNFSASRVVYTEWKISPINTPTPNDMSDDVNVPLFWDQRADQQWVGNHVTDARGKPAGHFAYVDGSVQLLSSPTNVIRGAPDVNSK